MKAASNDADIASLSEKIIRLQSKCEDSSDEEDLHIAREMRTKRVAMADVHQQWLEAGSPVEQEQTIDQPVCSEPPQPMPGDCAVEEVVEHPPPRTEEQDEFLDWEMEGIELPKEEVDEKTLEPVDEKAAGSPVVDALTAAKRRRTAAKGEGLVRGTAPTGVNDSVAAAPLAYEQWPQNTAVAREGFAPRVEIDSECEQGGAFPPAITKEPQAFGLEDGEPRV